MITKLYFESKYFKETFNFILNYKNLNVFDVEHAIDRLEERFENIDIKLYREIIKKGLDKIDISIVPANYVIIDIKKDIKIPLEIRPDRNKKHIIIGAIATTLIYSKHEFSLKNEIKIYVEKNKKGFFDSMHYFEEGKISKHWFNVYFEDGDMYYDFKIIEVE